jgi:hypothetical protein
LRQASLDAAIDDLETWESAQVDQVVVRTGTSLKEAKTFEGPADHIHARDGGRQHQISVRFEQVVKGRGEIAVLHDLEGDDGIEGVGF